VRSLCFTKIGNPETGELGELALLDLPKPVPGPQDVLIKLAYGGICGSDTHTLTGHVGALRELMMQMMPMPEGHEFSGIIEEVGEYAGQIGYKPGDRVVANYVKPCGSCYFCRTHRENFCQHPVNIVGGCADYICVNVSQVYKIPDSLSLKVAALTEPFTIAFNAVKMAKVHPGSRVAVFGGGAIGQMAAQAAKLAMTMAGKRPMRRQSFFSAPSREESMRVPSNIPAQPLESSRRQTISAMENTPPPDRTLFSSAL